MLVFGLFSISFPSFRELLNLQAPYSSRSINNDNSVLTATAWYEPLTFLCDNTNLPSSVVDPIKSGEVHQQLNKIRLVQKNGVEKSEG
jgi:hypothetical protein